MNQWNIGKIVALLQESGRMALSAIDHPHTRMKEDRTPVTDADKAVENLLSNALEDEENAVRVIGEETFENKASGYLDAAVKGDTWIIDPIDGTALFANKIPLWGTSIAFARNGVIKEGAVFIPSTGEMMLSDSGKVYYTHNPMPPEKWDFMSRLEELSPPDVHFSDYGIINLSQKITKCGQLECPNTVHSLCTCVYSGVLLATGRHMASFLSAKIWDIAGILPVLKVLGFHAFMRNGEDLMSLKITPEIYNFDFSSEDAFKLRSLTVLAHTEDIIKKVNPYCGEY